MGAARFQVKAEVPVVGRDNVWCSLLVTDARTSGWWMVAASLVLAGGAETNGKQVGIDGILTSSRFGGPAAPFPPCVARVAKVGASGSRKGIQGFLLSAFKCKAQCKAVNVVAWIGSNALD